MSFSILGAEGCHPKEQINSWNVLQSNNLMASFWNGRESSKGGITNVHTYMEQQRLESRYVPLADSDREFLATFRGPGDSTRRDYISMDCA